MQNNNAPPKNGKIESKPLEDESLFIRRARGLLQGRTPAQNELVIRMMSKRIDQLNRIAKGAKHD